jgi:hypothetical protein
MKRGRENGGNAKKEEMEKKRENGRYKGKINAKWGRIKRKRA